MLDPADNRDNQFYECRDGATFQGNHILNIARDMNTWGITRLATKVGASSTVNLIQNLPHAEEYLASFFQGYNHYTRAKEFYDGPGSCDYANTVVERFSSSQGGLNGQAITLRLSETAEEIKDDTLGDMPLGLVVCEQGLDMVEMKRLSTDLVYVRLDIDHSSILFDLENVEVGLRVVKEVWAKALLRNERLRRDQL